MTLYILLTLAALAQEPGTVTVVRPTTITAVTTAHRCTISTVDAGAHVAVYCYAGTPLVFNSSITIPANATGYSNAALVHYGLSGDRTTAMFWRPAGASVVHWQISANDVMKEGDF